MRSDDTGPAPSRAGEALSRIRPTPRALALIVLGFAPALLPAVADVDLWTLWPVFVGMTVLLMGWDLLGCPGARRVDVAVESPDRLYIGSHDPLVVCLGFLGGRHPLRLEVLPELNDLLETVPGQDVVLPPGESAEATFTLTPGRRGEGEVRALWMRWSGPLGLMRRAVRRPLGRTVPVVPDVRSVKDAAILAARSDAWSGLRQAKYVGEGSEFESLREFMPGLDPRTIDWKASARHHTLLSREFRAERDRPLIIALDTGHLMSKPVDGVPLLDRAINAGLHLAMVGLKVGDRVGLFAFDQQVRLARGPRPGIGHFPILLRDSASLEYSEAETNFTLGLMDLTSRLHRRSLVILLTDFVDTVTAELMVENVERLSKRHLVVMVTLRDPSLDAIADAAPDEVETLHRAVVSRDMIREREIVLRRLRRLGVLTIDAPPDGVSSQIIDRYLRIKRREMVG